MALDEFAVIKNYFQRPSVRRKDVILGSGDDCALLNIPAKQSLAVSIDTLISGEHFPVDTKPYDIGYRSLAVNLSDLAAMGAKPAWFTCALTLPEINTSWLQDFADGLFELANQFNVQLVGGDLTRGKLSITIQVHGFVPPKLALRRDGAKVGDAIYVSGKLGTAGFVLQQLKQKKPVSKKLTASFYHPQPRIDLGLALRGKAHSAIDISDGLVADLNHILEASHVGAKIYLNAIPVLPELKKHLNLALTAGDDYELCFTATDNLRMAGITKIGMIEKKRGLRILKDDGSEYQLLKKGYLHF